jgi:two-component system NtrC family sensor kinase
MPETGKRDYRSLKRRLILSMLLVCLAPLLLVGGAAYFQFQHYAERMVLDQQERLVLNHRDFIESYIRERVAELQAATNAFSREQLLSGELPRLFAVMQQGSGIYSDIGIIDDRGRHQMYVGPYNLAGRDYSRADWFLKLAHQDVVISDLFLGYRGVPHFIIAVKRHTPDGYWILRASLSMDYFSQLVERIRVGETGEAFLLDRQGTYQTKTLFEREPLKHSNFPYLAFHSGARTDSMDVAGRTYLCTHIWVVENQWLLVFRQDEAEAFAPLRQALLTSAIIILVGLTGVGLATLTASKKLVGFIERADAEKEHYLRQLLANSKMAALGELAAGVAHELNNPLGIIEVLRTWIQDLLADGGEAESVRAEVNDSAAKIGDQVERCRRITHDLLKFSRRTESDRVSTDAVALVKEMLQMVEHRARAENIQFDLEAAGPAPIVTSPSRLQQIVLNILNNAVDAMEGKGGSVKIGVEPGEGGIRMTFRDSGCGIPAENLQKVFEPFFTTKPVGKGTGLGLAVCYGLVQQMGGLIEIQSVVGAGTTFILTLPKTPPPAEESP